jgi:hypothetical protein
MDNKFKTGEIVYAKSEPGIKLIVKRHIDRIYYCQVHNDPNARERVYFERELADASEMTGKKNAMG